jgi:hypothetical protein
VAVDRFSGLTNQLLVIGNRDAIVSARKADLALGTLTRALNDGQVSFKWENVREFIRGRKDLIRAVRKDWDTSRELSQEELSYYGPKL